ncbi:hypothetical protein EDD85DRAFT_798930 [Armillaria nabsnona]|nr:hypothetical protein EDD85DRAFT_798930 [Armillaria nabsnona]
MPIKTSVWYYWPRHLDKSMRREQGAKTRRTSLVLRKQTSTKEISAGRLVERDGAKTRGALGELRGRRRTNGGAGVTKLIDRASLMEEYGPTKARSGYTCRRGRAYFLKAKETNENIYKVGHSMRTYLKGEKTWLRRDPVYFVSLVLSEKRFDPYTGVIISKNVLVHAIENAYSRGS